MQWSLCRGMVHRRRCRLGSPSGRQRDFEESLLSDNLQADFALGFEARQDPVQVVDAGDDPSAGGDDPVAGSQAGRSGSAPGHDLGNLDGADFVNHRIAQEQIAL